MFGLRFVQNSLADKAKLHLGSELNPKAQKYPGQHMVVSPAVFG